jgi:hypothetical protein
MRMKISFFPYDSPLTATRLLCKTQTYNYSTSFPPIPTTVATLGYIRGIVDLLILDSESGPFLRAVDKAIDKAPDYHSIVKTPIDLSQIHDRQYSIFDDFIADVNLMINNALLYYPPASRTRQSAIHLQKLFRSLLHKIVSTDPQNLTFEPLPKATERLADARRVFMRKRLSAGPSQTQIRTPTQVAPVSDSALRTLEEDLEALPSSGLLGVAEIVSNRSFDETVLPLKVRLSSLSPQVFEKVKKYVESVRTSQDGYYFSWRPILPPELQKIRDEYPKDLADWRGKIEVNEGGQLDEKWGMAFD